METQPTLDDVRQRMEALARLLISGRHADLEGWVQSHLGPCRAALEDLTNQAAQGRLPDGTRETCLEIRRLAGEIQSLLGHADQVRSGLTGILDLLFEGNSGSRYSSKGEPRMAAAPRIVAQA